MFAPLPGPHYAIDNDLSYDFETELESAQRHCHRSHDRNAAEVGSRQTGQPFQSVETPTTRLKFRPRSCLDDVTGPTVTELSDGKAAPTKCRIEEGHRLGSDTSQDHPMVALPMDNRRGR